jgi:hypothetical protein
VERHYQIEVSHLIFAQHKSKTTKAEVFIQPSISMAGKNMKDILSNIIYTFNSKTLWRELKLEIIIPQNGLDLASARVQIKYRIRIIYT